MYETGSKWRLKCNCDAHEGRVFTIAGQDNEVVLFEERHVGCGKNNFHRFFEPYVEDEVEVLRKIVADLRKLGDSMADDDGTHATKAWFDYCEKLDLAAFAKDD